jgi:shikimate kinase
LVANGADSAKKWIALVGLPGAGKTTVGRRLATRLRLPFQDSDALIEAETGLAVPDLFARAGEAQFRALERGVIARLAEGPPCVLATGGGAFLDPGSRDLLLARCIVVWLDGDAGAFAERAGPRPLLDAANPAGSLRRLAAARNPIYAEAHCRIDCGTLRPGQVVDLILAALRR